MNMGAQLVGLARELGAKYLRFDFEELFGYKLQENIILVVTDDYSKFDNSIFLYRSVMHTNMALIGFVSDNEYVFVTKDRTKKECTVETEDIKVYKKYVMEFIEEIKQFKYKEKLNKIEQDFK